MKRLILSLFLFLVFILLPFNSSFADFVDRTSDNVQKTMEVKNNEGELSAATFISGDTAYMMIYGQILYQDATVWNDLNVLANTEIRDVDVLINSPGGDIFAAFAIIGTFKEFEKQGFHFKAFGVGMIASAAVPLFVSFDNRKAGWGCIFMIHEPSSQAIVGKFSDLQSTNEIMHMLRDQYYSFLAERTNEKDIGKWKDWERDTKWFGLKEAKEIGLVPEVK